MIRTLPYKRKIGFVASGGAAKAACFHMGVALALQRKGFSFRTGLQRLAEPVSKNGREIEVMVGSSAGSFACSLIASGIPLEDVYRSFLGQRNGAFPMLKYKQMLNPNFMDTLFQFWRRLPKSFHARGTGSVEAFMQALLCANGFFSTEKLERFLRKEILPCNRFKDLAPELYIVTTTLDQPGRLICGTRSLSHIKHPWNYYDAETQYSTETDISHAAAASMSLPPFFRPYRLRTEHGPINCFDGEIRRTLSTHVAKDAGCDLIIVSYTHQPYHYREDIGTLMDYGIPSIMVQALYQLVESRIQNSREVHEMKRTIFEEIQKFGQKYSIDESALQELQKTLMEKIGYSPDVDYVFICPSAREEDLFFADHFNLSSKAMEEIAETGFRSAIRKLKDYNFTFRNDSENVQAQQAS